MAIPVARGHLAMAHAALPGLLPTPPKCTMLPLLPAPPCAVILPNNSPASARPSRADAAGGWDAHKTKPAGSPASLSSSSSSSGGRASSYMISRADSDERWDAHKKPASPASSSTASSSSAISNKTKTRWPTSSTTARAAPGSNDVESSFMPRHLPPPRSFYAGPGFITSPESSMLPKPSFMIRVA
ncbi:putative protein TPRXL [Panicum virgatum]|uniref:putative protein TPRXL n=1 Tax=Panicum virgatum TaxID=38727 RepID=UPI0019D5EE2F|nr:putative protein TPRXL [Panicum virgatum]